MGLRDLSCLLSIKMLRSSSAAGIAAQLIEVLSDDVGMFMPILSQGIQLSGASLAHALKHLQSHCCL